jgi:hypothetical protein
MKNQRQKPKILPLIILIFLVGGKLAFGSEDVRLDGARRPILSDDEENRARLEKINPFVGHIHQAATLRQAKEDLVFSIYSIVSIYVPTVWGDQQNMNLPDAADKICWLLKRFPIDIDVLYLEAYLQMNLLSLAGNFPDAEFRRVVETLDSLQADGLAGIWLKLLKDRMHGREVDPEEMNRLLSNFANRHIFVTNLRHYLVSSARTQDNWISLFAKRVGELRIGNK